MIIIHSKTGNDDTGLILVENVDQNAPGNADIVKATMEESNENFFDPNAEPFIPTKEWQVVKEGQSIPAGLHVRMNFQTHLKEAKLMDGDDGKRFEHLKKDSQTKAKSDQHDSEGYLLQLILLMLFVMFLE